MKWKSLIIVIFILVTGITIFSAWNHFPFCNASQTKVKINEFIKVDSLCENVIIVRMGYDAVTAVLTQKGIVVIDAGISNSLTAKYRKYIESEFKRKDFAYLINTHSHSDHTGGNQVFTDAIIIGHKNCLKEMTEYWKNKVKIKSQLSKIVNDYEKELDTLNPNSNELEEIFCQKSRYQSAYNDLLTNQIITPPSVTFNDSLCLFLGDVTLNLIYFGKAHSESDIIIHIPEKKILMVGDLFSKYGRPGIDDDNQDFERWIKVVKWIESRWTNIEIVIGGHGQIMSKEDLQLFNNYVKKKGRQIKRGT